MRTRPNVGTDLMSRRKDDAPVCLACRRSRLAGDRLLLRQAYFIVASVSNTHQCSTWRDGWGNTFTCSRQRLGAAAAAAAADCPAAVEAHPRPPRAARKQPIVKLALSCFRCEAAAPPARVRVSAWVGQASRRATPPPTATSDQCRAYCGH